MLPPRETHRLARHLTPTRLGLLALVLSFGGGAIARAEAAPHEATAETKTKTTTKKKKKKSKAKAKKDAADADAAATAAEKKRRRIGASPAYVVGDSDAHLINESAPLLEPFPTDSKAFKKAFAETRRDQIVDAEKAARDVKSPDRWRTVLFMLRGLPERNDPETCFWRVLSFYRLGELARARTLRENCELPSKDAAVLNSEDVTAAGIPQMGTVAVDDGFGPRPGGEPSAPKSVQEPKPAPSPVAIAAAPYTGPSPQKH